MRGNSIFQTQHVGKLFIKLARPHGGTVADTEQLDSHANAILGAPDSTIEHESDSQLATGYQRIRVGAVAQNTAGWSHGKTSNGAQSRDKCVCESGPKVVRSRV